MRTAYRCRAYTDSEQAAQLGRTFGCVRLVWNKPLAERHAAYRQRGERTSYQQTDAALTGWKKTQELAFLSEVSSVPLQQTLRHQHTAFANFFADRARSPRFKSRTASAFVADFVGLTNRVPGQAADGHAEVLGARIPLLEGSAEGAVEVLLRSGTLDVTLGPSPSWRPKPSRDERESSTVSLSPS